MAITSVTGWTQVVDGAELDTMLQPQGGDIIVTFAAPEGDAGISLLAGDKIIVKRGEDCYAKSKSGTPVAVAAFAYDHPGSGSGGGGGS